MSDARDEYDPEELVNAAAIARRLVPPLHRVRVWQLARDDPSFPTPMPSAGRSTLWRWGDVEKWAETRGRGRVIRLARADGVRLERVASERGRLVQGRLSSEEANALVAELLLEAEAQAPPTRRAARRRRTSS